MSRNEIKKNSSSKEINSHIASLEGQIEAEELLLQQKLKEIQQKKSVTKALRKKVKKMNKSEEPIISEHCYARYCQRIGGIKFEDVQNEIISPEIKEMFKTLPMTGTFPNKKGYSVIFKNGIATTIILQEDAKKEEI